MSTLTAERVRELLDYCPETGIATWKVARGCVPKGKQAGFRSDNGYLGIRVDGRQYHLHRILYLHHHAVWPAFVDHINGIRDDNRAANLRSVTRSENQRNQKRSSANRSGVTGVFWNTGKQKWTARIKVHRVNKHLGDFLTIEEAAAARKSAERELGFSERHGSEQGVILTNPEGQAA